MLEIKVTEIKNIGDEDFILIPSRILNNGYSITFLYDTEKGTAYEHFFDGSDKATNFGLWFNENIIQRKESLEEALALII